MKSWGQLLPRLPNSTELGLEEMDGVATRIYTTIIKSDGATTEQYI
jgi:hypothetical protein